MHCRIQQALAKSKVFICPWATIIVTIQKLQIQFGIILRFYSARKLPSWQEMHSKTRRPPRKSFELRIYTSHDSRKYIRLFVNLWFDIRGVWGSSSKQFLNGPQVRDFWCPRFFTCDWSKDFIESVKTFHHNVTTWDCWAGPVAAESHGEVRNC